MKVFIIGLDGATFQLILPLISEGHMPFLKKLLSESAWGELQSTYPPLTAPAWASFMTGMTPGNHGIFDFFYRRHGSYAQSLYSILNIKNQIFWNILGEHGKSVGIINLPMTYPPQPVNGFMISGLLTPHGKKDFTYPSHLLEDIEENYGPYLLHHDQTGKQSSVLDQEYELLACRTAVAKYLYKRHPKDFFMVHFYGTDRIQHEFWHLLDQRHPLYCKRHYEQYGRRIIGFYNELDKSIKELVDLLDEDTVLIIMSDHGFGSIHKFMNINIWLVNEGFMHFKRNLLSLFRRLLFSLGFTYSNMAKLILRAGFGKRAIQLGRARRQKLQEIIFLSLKDVDWRRTKAYSIGNFGQVYINLEGREPQGIVSEREYGPLCEEIMHRLANFQDAETGLKIADKIFRKGEIFEGIYSSDAPDLFFLTRDMNIKPSGLSDFTSKGILEKAFGSTGHHQMNGIFIAYNKEIIKRVEKIKGCHIIDLAPTILYILGHSIPSYMDGKVLLDIFKEKFITNNTVRYISDVQKNIQAGGSPYTKEEEDMVKEQLRKLGYL